MSVENNPTPALHRLLDESLRYPPEYGNDLSSHLPMALAALQGLGADEARLRVFFTVYVRRFSASAASVEIDPAPPATDWPALRGRFEAFESLRSTFATELKSAGADKLLRSALPRLIDGIGAAAFHGLIRVAHAVESRHDGELATALAYWGARWMPLPAPDAVEADIDDVSAWLAAIDSRLLEDDVDWRSPAPLIIGRMRDATQTGAYRSQAGRLRSSGRDRGRLLADLALAAAARYAATRNFTVLHMATAARAARVIAPWLPEDDLSLAPLWHAVAAASLASGAATAPQRPMPGGATPDWQGVRALAIASDDEHVIKLVHAMAVQHVLAPDPRWLRAAAVAAER